VSYILTAAPRRQKGASGAAAKAGQARAWLYLRVARPGGLQDGNLDHPLTAREACVHLEPESDKLLFAFACVS
jgi:hypothetical protein